MALRARLGRREGRVLYSKVAMMDIEVEGERMTADQRRTLSLIQFYTKPIYAQISRQNVLYAEIRT
jgi:hypothetical protein